MVLSKKLLVKVPINNHRGGGGAGGCDVDFAQVNRSHFTSRLQTATRSM